MADEPEVEKLRQMAEHRGLKLVKSRRRKAGVGDYGRFGLTDAAGKALLGIGDDGLTASAPDIAAYLRAGTLGIWQQSAASAKAAPKPKPPAPKAAARAKPKPRSTPEPRPVSNAAPTRQLAIRPAKSTDADALAKLLNSLSGIAIDAETARRNLASVQTAGGGMLLAELGKPIGGCAWAVVHTLHRGLVGRITGLFVASDHRRQGIASQLLAAAEQALASTGCTLVEVMSDIQIDNAHNFFRARKFEQASYRFVRKLVH